MTRAELEEEIIKETAGLIADARATVIRLEDLIRKLHLAFPPKTQEDKTT